MAYEEILVGQYCSMLFSCEWSVSFIVFVTSSRSAKGMRFGINPVGLFNVSRFVIRKRTSWSMS